MNAVTVAVVADGLTRVFRLNGTGTLDEVLTYSGALSAEDTARTVVGVLSMMTPPAEPEPKQRRKPGPKPKPQPQRDKAPHLAHGPSAASLLAWLREHGPADRPTIHAQLGYANRQAVNNRLHALRAQRLVQEDAHGMVSARAE